jgi:hypothetical protein
MANGYSCKHGKNKGKNTRLLCCFMIGGPTPAPPPPLASDGGGHVPTIRTKVERLREMEGVVGFGDGMGTQRRRQLTKKICRIKSKTLFLDMKNKAKPYICMQPITIKSSNISFSGNTHVFCVCSLILLINRLNVLKNESINFTRYCFV